MLFRSGQFNDLKEVVKWIVRNCCRRGPLFNTTLEPGQVILPLPEPRQQALAIIPLRRFEIRPPNTQSFRFVMPRLPQKDDSQLLIVDKVPLVWRSHASRKKGDIPIIAVGNFRLRDGKLFAVWNNKELDDLLPIYVNKNVGDLILEGIVGYKVVQTSQRKTDIILVYQVFDRKTKVRKTYEQGLFHWEKYEIGRAHV